MSKVSKDYLWVTFLTMTLLWGICTLFSINGYGLNSHFILYFLWILGGLTPTMGSYIALKKNKEVKGLNDWLKRIFDIKQNICSYAVAIILPIIYYLFQCIIVGYEIGMPLYFLFVLIPLMIIGGGLEEAGWRMILQPELEKKHGFVMSTLIVSVIWWIWHLPLFFMQGTGQFGTNFYYFGLVTLAGSFAFAAIKNVTGSVFLCILSHSLNNALSSIFVFKGTLFSNCVTTAVIIALSIVIVRQRKLPSHIK